MPKVPRDLTQDEAVRAFLKAGGVELKARGKGSHRNIEMPNGATLTIPYHVKPGLISASIKQAGLKLEEFWSFSNGESSSPATLHGNRP